MNIFGFGKPTTRIWLPQIQAVRNRYWKEQIKENKVRRYGYEDDFFHKGLLPRSPELDKVKSMPIYRPKDVWTEQRSLFGQNDYIDILGDGRLHPAQIAQGVPDWLKEFKGNEYERLMRRMKMFGPTMCRTRPAKWKKMLTRFEQLYYFYNYRKKPGLPKKE